MFITKATKTTNTLITLIPRRSLQETKKFRSKILAIVESVQGTSGREKYENAYPNVLFTFDAVGIVAGTTRGFGLAIRPHNLAGTEINEIYFLNSGIPVDEQDAWKAELEAQILGQFRTWLAYEEARLAAPATA